MSKRLRGSGRLITALEQIELTLSLGKQAIGRLFELFSKVVPNVAIDVVLAHEDEVDRPVVVAKDIRFLTRGDVRIERLGRDYARLDRDLVCHRAHVAVALARTVGHLEGNATEATSEALSLQNSAEI